MCLQYLLNSSGVQQTFLTPPTSAQEVGPAPLGTIGYFLVNSLRFPRKLPSLQLNWLRDTEMTLTCFQMIKANWSLIRQSSL